MRKAILFISLSLLLLVTACQSAESKEIVEYHNGFVKEVVSGVEIITAGYEEMDSVETDEEVIEIGNTKILPTLDEKQAYMDSQNPKEDDTKEYHKLRLEWFEIYSEIVRREIQALDDYINDVITDEELEEILAEITDLAESGEALATEADARINELADKHNFELVDEE